MAVTLGFSNLVNSTSKLSMSTSNECPVRKKIGSPFSTPSTQSTPFTSSNTNFSPSSFPPYVAEPVKFQQQQQQQHQQPANLCSSNVSSFFIKDILSGFPQPPHHLYHANHPLHSHHSSFNQHHYQLLQSQSTLESDEENEFSDYDEHDQKVEIKVQKKQRKARTAFTDHQLQVSRYLNFNAYCEVYFLICQS